MIRLILSQILKHKTKIQQEYDELDEIEQQIKHFKKKENYMKLKQLKINH